MLLAIGIYLFVTIVFGYFVHLDTPWWHRYFIVPPVFIFVVIPFIAYNFVFEKITGRSIRFK